MERVFHGRLDKMNVASALNAVASGIASKASCIVRGIDSIRDPGDLLVTLVARGVHGFDDAGNICVDFLQLLDAAKAGSFTGFDEIWIFAKDRTPRYSLYDVPAATSDVIDAGSDLPSELYEEFKKSQCDLILADGIGLNFVTRDPRILRALYHA